VTARSVNEPSVFELAEALQDKVSELMTERNDALDLNAELVESRERAIRWAVTLESQNAELVEAIGAIHRPKTFEVRSDHHHSEALAAVGAIAPRRHDCSAECFEWVTVCDGDGTNWPCSTAVVVAALTGSTE
jgi:hypothetical protein